MLWQPQPPPCKGKCYSVLWKHKGEKSSPKPKPRRCATLLLCLSCSKNSVFRRHRHLLVIAPTPPEHCTQLVQPPEHSWGPGIFWKVAALLQVLGSFDWPLTHVHRPSTKYLQMTLPFLSDCWWGLSWSLLL